MPIRDSLARWLGVVPKASIVGLSANELADVGLEKRFDDAALLSTYADDAWPYICARILAENGAMPPLRFGTLDEEGDFDAVAPDHPVQQLFDNPNPTMTGREFRQLLITYLELVGHGPIEVVKPTPGAMVGRGRRGRAGFELWPHNPSPWRIVGNPDGTVKGYLWLRGAAGDDIRWTPDQMNYLRWVNPLDRYYGQGRIQAVRQSIMAEEYAAIRDKRFEKTLGVPPGILSSEMPLGDPQAAELQRRWEKAVGGYANAGKIAILGSKTTYQPIAANARDAQWIEQRRWRIQEFGAAFGIPVVILVGMKDATFANAGEAVDYLWEFTLQPRLDQIADMLTQRILPLVTTEPLVARFDYSQVDALNDNEAEVVSRAKGMTDTGVATIDEVRRVMGLEPLRGEIGERLVSPTTLDYRSQEQISAPPPAPTPLPAATPPVAEPPEAEPPEEEVPAPAKARKAEVVVPPEQRRDNREELLRPVMDAFSRDLAAFFAAQLAALTPVLGKGIPIDEGRDIVERAVTIINARRWYDRLQRIARPALSSAITTGASAAATALGVDLTFALPASESALQLLEGRTVQIANVANGFTATDVRRVLENGLRAGQSHAELRESLRGLFDDYKDWRVDRIVRTETLAAYNLGSIGQFRDAGIATVTVTDGDGDFACANANGATWTLEMAEADPYGHPNCTRVFMPDTGGLLAAEPAAVKADDGLMRVELRLPAIHIAPPAVSVAAPVVNVAPGPAPVVNVEAQKAPIVHVDAPDFGPLTARLDDLAAGMREVKAEVSRPRQRRLVKDEFTGKIIGSEEI